MKLKLTFLLPLIAALSACATDTIVQNDTEDKDYVTGSNIPQKIQDSNQYFK